MRYVLILLGILLVLKGLHECIELARALAPLLHAHSAYAAGKAAGGIVGTLAVLAGGVALIAQGWRAKRGGSPA